MENLLLIAAFFAFFIPLHFFFSSPNRPRHYDDDYTRANTPTIIYSNNDPSDLYHRRRYYERDLNIRSFIATILFLMLLLFALFVFVKLEEGNTKPKPTPNTPKAVTEYPERVKTKV